MKAPTRWRDQPPSNPEEAQARELIAQDGPTPWAARDERRFWSELEERLAGSPARRRFSFVWILAPVAALVIAVALLPRLGEEQQARVVASTGSVFEESPGSIHVKRGRVETALRGGARARVRTSQLEIFSASARVAVEVTDRTTKVWVLEGTAVLRDSTGHERTLSAPMSAEIPSRPSECPPTDDLSSRVQCLQSLALGSGLAAQNALFLLARIEREQGRVQGSLAAFENYLKRFPRGAHATEAEYARIELLAEEGGANLQAPAQRFLEEHPKDGRIGRIQQLMRKNIEGRNR